MARNQNQQWPGATGSLLLAAGSHHIFALSGSLYLAAGSHHWYSGTFHWWLPFINCREPPGGSLFLAVGSHLSYIFCSSFFIPLSSFFILQSPVSSLLSSLKVLLPLYACAFWVEIILLHFPVCFPMSLFFPNFIKYITTLFAFKKCWVVFIGHLWASVWLSLSQMAIKRIFKNNENHTFAIIACYSIMIILLWSYALYPCVSWAGNFELLHSCTDYKGICSLYAELVGVEKDDSLK